MSLQYKIASGSFAVLCFASRKGKVKRRQIFNTGNTGANLTPYWDKLDTHTHIHTFCLIDLSHRNFSYLLLNSCLKKTVNIGKFATCAHIYLKPYDRKTSIVRYWKSTKRFLNTRHGFIPFLKLLSESDETVTILPQAEKINNK